MLNKFASINSIDPSFSGVGKMNHNEEHTFVRMISGHRGINYFVYVHGTGNKTIKIFWMVLEQLLKDAILYFSCKGDENE